MDKPTKTVYTTGKPDRFNSVKLIFALPRKK
jgi:hypothetical protein